jgi:hypothetical protein
MVLAHMDPYNSSDCVIVQLLCEKASSWNDHQEWPHVDQPVKTRWHGKL